MAIRRLRLASFVKGDLEIVLMIKSLVCVGFAAFTLSGVAFAADLPARNGPPVPPPVLASCLENNTLATDVFGFTVGSDVTDVGAWGGTLTANGNFTARGQRLTGVTGVAQVATGLFRCFEVGPYAYLNGTSAKDKAGISGNSSFYGGGVEFKYKVLGRDVHGVGATLDLDLSGNGNRFSGLLGAGNDSAFNVAARLFLDRELVKDKLYGAINLEHISTYSSRTGVLVDGSQFNIRAAVSAKVLPNFFVGAEAWYSRTYLGAGYRTYLGDGFFIGPNALWAINDKWTLNAAYQVQVAGKLRLAPGNLNLAHYNQHYARIKLGYAF
ncbi:MAG: hypothetical protein NT037_00330 [Hyphomicrobiales bacterium]|nr:hypothetical protein [Hyphomicrobiales bacterium]